MTLIAQILLLVLVLPGRHAPRQRAITAAHDVVIRGDTSAAPPSCSAAAAVAAIQGWFRAVASGDAAAVRSSVSPHFSVVSAGVNGAAEPFFRADNMSQLLAYVRRRARVHERLDLRSVTFNGWHGQSLWFGPISYDRVADDVPGGSHAWIGKGVYACNKGLSALNTAPLPSNMPRAP
jgi:hypothetical protein